MPSINPVNRVDAFLGASLRLIIILFLGRFIIDIGTRMVFPFIPQLSAGLGMTAVTFSLLISIRTLTGVSSPLLGLLSDHFGRRKLMAIGLVCQAIGVLGLIILPWPGAILAMIIFGLALAAFFPAQQAYIGDQVPYIRRGRVMALVELSWASAAIFALPLVGWLIDEVSWRSPFLIVSLLSLITASLVWLRLPAIETRSHSTLSWGQVREICLRGNVIATIGVALLIFVAVNAYVTVWGLWLTADFGFGATTLGFVATGIGIAEGLGAGTSSLIIDRLGKKRGSSLTLVITTLFFIALPFSQNNPFIAIATLISMGLFIEFTVVSLIPIYSEQVPEARATVMALVLLGSALGGTAGAPLAATLWEWQGLAAVCALAAVSLLAALLILWKFLQES
jgi:predicted MFS family arabinose efflux permease